MSGGRRDAAWLVRSSPGRLELRRRYSKKLWPLSSRIASLYRRTAARRTTVVVVVGSVGKTTTMRAVTAALGLKAHPLAGANSYSAVSGALLRVRPWQSRSVIEVGIGGPGEMGEYAAMVRPDVTVVTAIASDHWPTLHTLERTRDEKADMVRALPRSGVAVLNADDPHVRWMATQSRARVIWYGLAPDADVRATDVELDWPHGTRFTVRVGTRTWPVRTRLVGQHMVYPVLAALAVALAEGVPLDEAVPALEALAPGSGKMQPVVLANGGIVLQDDAKGTVATYHAALDALAAIPSARKSVVFGEIRQPPLPEDATYRELGERVASIADRAIFVGKRFDDYRAGAVSGGLAPDRIQSAVDAQGAIELLRGGVGPDEVVLVKGLWQQRLARVGLALSGEDVRCRVDPCPFKRTMCDECPFLGKPFRGYATRP